MTHKTEHSRRNDERHGHATPANRSDQTMTSTYIGDDTDVVEEKSAHPSQNRTVYGGSGPTQERPFLAAIMRDGRV